MRCKSESLAAQIIVSEALERGFEISVVSYADDVPTSILFRATDAEVILHSLNSGSALDRVGLVSPGTGDEAGYFYLKYGECRDLIIDFPAQNLDCAQIAYAVKAELAEL